MSIAMVFEGLELLSDDQKRGLRDMLQGAINVMLKHRNDPERGDVGWRKQDLESHLDHAEDHVRHAAFACDADSDGDDYYYRKLDDDGLPHVDHATARIALYYARKLALKEQDASCD